MNTFTGVVLGVLAGATFSVVGAHAVEPGDPDYPIGRECPNVTQSAQNYAVENPRGLVRLVTRTLVVCDDGMRIVTKYKTPWSTDLPTYPTPPPGTVTPEPHEPPVDPPTPPTPTG